MRTLSLKKTDSIIEENEVKPTVKKLSQIVGKKLKTEVKTAIEDKITPKDLE